MTMKAYLWTPDKVDEIRQLMQSGCTWDEVAQKFNSTKERLWQVGTKFGIKSCRHRGGRPARVWTAEKVNQLRRLMESGYSWGEAAKHLNSSRGRAIQVGIKFGIKSRIPIGAPLGNKNACKKQKDQSNAAD